jgi:hypothetical protein
MIDYCLECLAEVFPSEEDSCPTCGASSEQFSTATKGEFDLRVTKSTSSLEGVDSRNIGTLMESLNSVNGGNLSFTGSPSTPASKIFMYTTNVEGIDSPIRHLGMISGVGYRWVWLNSADSIRKAESKAIQELTRKARNLRASGVVGFKTSIAFFPGFIFIRGCAVHVSGTAIANLPDSIHTIS